MTDAVVSDLAVAAQLSLGLVFAISAVPKLRRPVAFARRVAEYRILPARLAYVLAFPLMIAEAALGAAFIAGWQVRLALMLSALVLSVFLVAVGTNLARGRRVECGCFGNASERISSQTVARLLVLLAAVAVLLAVGAVGPGGDVGIVSVATGRTGAADLLAAGLVAISLLLLAAWGLRLSEIVRIAAHLVRGEEELR